MVLGDLGERVSSLDFNGARTSVGGCDRGARRQGGG